MNASMVLQGQKTPLHCAAHIGHLKMAQMLLERGADLSSEDHVSVSATVTLTLVQCCSNATAVVFLQALTLVL